MVDTFGLLSATANPLLRLAKWMTLEMRVVRVVRADMTKLGIKLDSPKLRHLMYQKEFRRGLIISPDQATDLNEHLAACINPSTATNAASLKESLLRAFSTRLPGATASSDFLEGRNGARHQSLLTKIEAVNQSIDTVGDQTLFDSRVMTMPPLRAAELRELNSEWPPTASALGALARSDDRTRLLAKWATHIPAWLEAAPPQLFGILAEMSQDKPGKADPAVASAFITRALDAGIEPREYWRLELQTLSSEDDVLQVGPHLSDARGYPLVEAALHPEGFDAAINQLNAWRPPSGREELRRQLTLVELYERSGLLDDAIDQARTAYREFDSTAGAIKMARLLISRHRLQATPQADLAESLTLAIEARAARRRWGIDSGQALATEMQARRALSDHRGVIALANGSGEVPATEEELVHPEVLLECATAHAQFGDLQVAKRLESKLSKQRSYVRAIIAEREQNDDDAKRLWQLAIDDSANLGERAHIALQLAFHGIRASTVDELLADNKGVAEELTLIANVFSEFPGALERLRGFANSDHRGSLLLFTYYTRRGNHKEAASVARIGATRWNDPNLWLESGRFHRSINDHAQAISDFKSALSAAERTWGNRAEAFRHLIEVYSETGRWSEARNAAAQLLAAQPEDPSAAWALVLCQLHLHDYPGALKTWLRQGSPEPTSEQEAEAWIALLSEFGAEVGTARDALDIAGRFTNNETIRQKIVGALIMPTRSSAAVPEASQSINRQDEQSDGSDPPNALNPLDIDASREIIQAYLRDFPHGAIRAYPLNGNNIRDGLVRILDSPSPSAAVDSQLQNGQLPLGLAGELHGKSYLETLLAREFGPVFTRATDLSQEKEILQIADERGVVIDLSAIATMAKLPDEVRILLLGAFSGARVLLEQQGDVVNGSRFIRADSGLGYRPGQGATEGVFFEKSRRQLSKAVEYTDIIEDSFSLVTVVTHPRLVSQGMADHEELALPFLLAADHALEKDIPLWVDDRALAQIVHSLGGTTFDTPAMLRHVRRDGNVNSDLLDVSEANLVGAGYTDMQFGDNVWNLAALLADTPQGIANSLGYGGFDAIQSRLGFGLVQVESHVGEPLHLSMWVHAVAIWVESLGKAQDDERNKVRLLMLWLLSREWQNEDTMPFCLDGFRALNDDNGLDIALEATHAWYLSMAKTAGTQAAALQVFTTIRHLDPKDAYRVRSAIVSGTFA